MVITIRYFKIETLSENTEKTFYFDSLEVFWSTTNFIKFCIVKQDGLFREYLCEGTGIRKIVTNILKILLHWTGYVTDQISKCCSCKEKQWFCKNCSDRQVKKGKKLKHDNIKEIVPYQS